MKTKLLKIGAFALAVLLIVGVVVFANALIGNPISNALATNTAKKYIEKTYAGTDYELTGVNYSFKDGYYHAGVKSKSSIDTHFSLMIDSFGNLKEDYFDEYVSSGWNTAHRIDLDYRNNTKTLFESASFPFNAYITFGEIILVSEEYEGLPDTPDYAIPISSLTMDAFYNANELGKSHGKLTVYIYDDSVTVERLSEVLLEIRRCFDDAGIGFYAINCVIEYTRDENGAYDVGRVEVMDFRYSDIYEEGLVERVDKANKEAEEYYRLADLEKDIVE